MATLFIFTGIYAFKRINKLGYGILIYVLSSGVLLIAFIVDIISPTKYMMIITQIIYFISYLLPLLAMYKWTNQYNKSINFERAS